MKTHRITDFSASCWLSHIICLIAALSAGGMASRSLAEDWGAYSLVPLSAQAMVLEAVGSGTDEGSIVSINKPAGTANQKWVITPKEDSFYSIKPSSNSSLALSVAKGETKNGAAIVLEKDGGQPWQLWSLMKHENGSYSLVPRHAPEKGLDDQGGKQTPGAKIDLWENTANDQHLHGWSGRWRAAPFPRRRRMPALLSMSRR